MYIWNNGTGEHYKFPKQVYTHGIITFLIHHMFLANSIVL
jgi:hypothetical protein